MYLRRFPYAPSLMYCEISHNVKECQSHRDSSFFSDVLHGWAVRANNYLCTVMKRLLIKMKMWTNYGIEILCLVHGALLNGCQQDLCHTHQKYSWDHCSLTVSDILDITYKSSSLSCEIHFSQVLVRRLISSGETSHKLRWNSGENQSKN